MKLDKIQLTQRNNSKRLLMIVYYNDGHKWQTNKESLILETISAIDDNIVKCVRLNNGDIWLTFLSEIVL